MIRVDLLEKNGIEKPTTWEGLVDVLEQLHEIYPDMTPGAPAARTASSAWTA
jgi:ABC-type glycerol-3-phosphate transport system substrate-binding protein